MSNFFKNNWIHFAAYAIGLIVCLVKFSPQLDGNAIKQHDIEQHKGMSQETRTYYDTKGRTIGWTNSMFGGMPTTQISMRYDGNYISKINSAYSRTFGNPIGIVLMYFIGFYILMCSLKINSWIGITMSLCFAFVSYDIIIIQAGHNSKSMAVAWMAPVIGAFFITYQRNILLGAALSALFMAFEMAQNHLQVTYYMGILLICLGVAAFVNALIKKALPRFFKASAGLVVAYGLALVINLGNVLGTSTYAEGTIRGGNDIKVAATGELNSTNETSGLDRDYVVNWSNGIAESLQLFSPYIKGVKSDYVGNTKFADDVAEMDLTPEEMEAANKSNSYWGEQPFVSGPAYVGAITVFLAILGLIFLKGTWKWGIFAATMLTIMLSWGKNYMGLTNFFLDNVPGYNKFRAVTILIVIAELTLPLLAALLLNEFYKNREEFVAKRKTLLISCSAILAVTLIIKFAGVGDYLTSNEKQSFVNAEASITAQIAKAPAAQMLQQYQLDVTNPAQMKQFVDAQVEQQSKAFVSTKKIRDHIYNSSLNTSFILVLLAAGLLLISVYTKSFPPLYAVLIIAVLNFGDLVNVSSNFINSEYNNPDNPDDGYKLWTSKTETLYPIAGNSADQQILDLEVKENPSLAKAIAEGKKIGEGQADDLEAIGVARTNIVKAATFAALNAKTNYRVWDASGNFNSADVSMFHKSLGGYHGAKLRNIQNLFDFHLSQNNNGVYNMMNAKYFIQDQGGQKVVRVNPEACSNAWLVKTVTLYPTADEEIRALGSLFELKNAGNGTLVVNGKVQQTSIVTGSEKLQYLMKAGDTITVPLSNGLAEGVKFYCVSDTAGKVDLVPETTILNDPFKSFNSLVQITAKSVFDPKTEAMMLSSMSSQLTSKSFSGLGSIRMKSYDPEHLQYQFSSPEKQLAVFSEVYYTKGWTAYLDGKEVPILKVNYILRGLEIPKGDHKVEFKYVTPKLATYNLMASIACLILFLGLGLVGYFQAKTLKNSKINVKG